jgi:hypothetical protein
MSMSETDPTIWDDPKRLEEWTIFHLHKLDADEMEWHNQRLSNWVREVASKPRDPQAAAVQAAIASAEYGNLDPLRKLLPRIARFLNPPPPPPPKRGPKRNYFREAGNPIGEAHDDVRRVRALWREHFGHVYRAISPRATEIAAARYGLTEKQLLDDRKTRYRRKRGR